MPRPAGSLRTLRPQLDEPHWRAAAEEGARHAAEQWRIPLANIAEVALIDAEHVSAEGPCYVFKLMYIDHLGQRCTGAVYMPRCVQYGSPLQFSELFNAQPAQRRRLY